MKKVLFIYRNKWNYDRRRADGSIEGPDDFFWGMTFMEKDGVAVRTINAPRLEKRKGIRWWTNFVEFPFSRLVKIGLPIEIYPLFKKDLEWADEIVCVNDQISLGVLFWRCFGKLKHQRVHCVVMSLPEREKSFRRFKPMVWLVSHFLNEADTILSLSKFAQEATRRIFLIKKSKMRVMYFGIDKEYWSPVESHDKKNGPLLSVGNDMNRDYRTLVEALNQNRQTVIVTKQKFDTKNKAIKLVTWIEDDALLALYNKAFLAIIPSITLKYESSGLSCALQCMATKTPVILPNNPTLTELFEDRRHCLFYEPQNAGDLKEKIALLSSDEDLYRRLQKQGRSIVEEKFNTQVLGKRLEKHIGV